MAMPFWQIARARSCRSSLPAAMLEGFAGHSLSERMIALLRFLAPITGGEAQAL
jgi:hypothetical protein